MGKENQIISNDELQTTLEKDFEKTFTQRDIDRLKSQARFWMFAGFAVFVLGVFIQNSYLMIASIAFILGFARIMCDF